MVRLGLFLVASFFSLSLALGADQRPLVKTAAAKVEALYDLYAYPVTLESKKESEVFSEIDGLVKSLQVQLGQVVKEGEALLSLQRTSADYSAAPILVKSPISGTVAEISKKIGARVQAGDKLVYLVNRSEFGLHIEVPEAELSLLQKGQAGTLELRVLEGELPVWLAGVSPLVKPLSGTAQGELELYMAALPESLKAQVQRKLFPGMVGQARFKLNFRRGIAVPKEAVAFEKQKYLVRVVVGEKAVKRTVSLGKEVDGRVEVTSGLSEGEQVIISRSKYLKENELVKVDQGEASKDE